MSAMRRKMLWVEGQNFQGWACSEQRDKEFASHVCADHPRPTKNPR
jgi:hypothetical protein